MFIWKRFYKLFWKTILIGCISARSTLLSVIAFRAFMWNYPYYLCLSGKGFENRFENHIIGCISARSTLLSVIA